MDTPADDPGRQSSNDSAGSRHCPGGKFVPPPRGSPRSTLPDSFFTDLNDSESDDSTSTTYSEHDGRDRDEAYHETVHEIDNRDASTPDR